MDMSLLQAMKNETISLKLTRKSDTKALMEYENDLMNAAGFTAISLVKAKRKAFLEGWHNFRMSPYSKLFYEFI